MIIGQVIIAKMILIASFIFSKRHKKVPFYTPQKNQTAFFKWYIQLGTSLLLIIILVFFKPEDTALNDNPDNI